MAKWWQSSKSNIQKEAEASQRAERIAQNAMRSLENSKKSSSRAYAGAMFNRLTASWVATTTSMDSEIRGSLKALRNRSRDLARNNDFVRQFLRAVENNVVGQGIPFQAQVKLKTGDLDLETNKLIEKAWEEWCNKDSCHTAGKLSFNDIERLCIRATAESGEIFVRMIKKNFGKSRVKFALEIIEADLLNDDYNGISEYGNTVRMGVEMDDFQRPIAYHFRKEHPGDFNMPSSNQGNSKESIRIPAKEIIALFKTERPGQTRGVPWLSSSIIRLHHVQGYEEATVIQKRAESSLMGFIESPEGELKGDGAVGSDQVTDFEPGVFKHLAPGERVNIPNISKSAGEFDPFMRSMLRAVAAGIGCSYETLSRDYSQSNYSSSRLALIDDRDNWRSLQSWMIENFHQIIFSNWLEMAVMSGVLKLNGYEIEPKRFEDVRWMPRGWAWVDPAKEVAAYKEALRGGFTTLHDVIAQSGGDFEDVMALRNKEEETIRSYGLVFDSNAAVSENINSKSNSAENAGQANKQD